MRPGDLIFVRGNTWVSKAIRQITGGHYSHVDIFIGKGQAIGAELGVGVRKVEYLSAYGSDALTVCMVACSDATAQAVVNDVCKMVGTQYDARGLFGVWARFALKRLGIHLTSTPADQTGAYFCSEMAAALYRKQGIEICPDLHPSLTSPTDLYEANVVIEIKEERRP